MKSALSLLSSTLSSRCTTILPVSWRTSSFPAFTSSSLPFMAQNSESGQSNPPITATTQVEKFHQVFHSESKGDWDKCWEEGLTPWDLGQPTPVLVHLHETGALSKGRVLVPGCGTGYDVVAIASPERYVVGIDLSESAISRAAELSASSPNADYFTFIKADFFSWRPTELFDLIFDYTFFCAIEPSMRSAWANKMCDLLKPDGKLLTLMFPISDHEGGPPYKVSITDYEHVLHPLGFKAISIMDNELAIKARKGREKIGWWQKSAQPSSL